MYVESRFTSLPFASAPRRTLVAVALAAMLAVTPHAPAIAKSLPTAPHVVTTTTAYDGLVIPQGQTIVAPPGMDLTLTVNGVSVPIQPGTYTGKVVLTVSDDIPVHYKALPVHHFRTGVYVDNGHYIPNKSVAAAVRSGKIDDHEARNVVIDSREQRFNGIIVTGNSKYVIDHPVIDLTGNGGNDFAGFGAAIMSSGNADVTVKSPKIRTRGAVRTAIFVGGHSVMHVDDADIEVANGTLPPNYHFTIEVGKMMEVPWMLGLSGNVRATNLVDHGTVYYNRAHIRAQGWGALSTDDAAVTRMYVKDSLIETIDSGYGAYSIGDSVDTFSHTVFNVADVGLIMAAQGSGVFTDGSIVNSRRFGVMMHSGNGGGTLTIDKGSVFNTRSTAIQIKSRGAKVLIDNAKLVPGNGVILQAMVNDDPFMKKMLAGGGPIVGEQGPGGAAHGAMPAPPPDAGPDVQVLLRNTKLAGDFVNTRTGEGGLIVKLENATVTGAITTGTQAPVGGKEPGEKTYRLIGDVVNHYEPTPGPHGVEVSVGSGSQWVVKRTSYLNHLELTKGGTIVAPEGYRLTLEVNGKPQPLRPGNYAGAIVLEVSALH